MKNVSGQLFCTNCGARVVYRKLEAKYKKSLIFLPTPQILYYRYKCPDCKIVSEFYPQVIKDAWAEENPGIRGVIPL